MKSHEFFSLLREANENLDKLKKLYDVFDLLAADIHLGIYAHKTYLPAAKDYLRGKHSGDHRTKSVRTRRARLGGASRWLFYHQKKTFEKIVHILCPGPIHISDDMINVAWSLIKSAEIKALSNARRKA